RLRREVDPGVLVAKERVAVDEDVGGTVDANALPAPPRRVVDGDSVSRPLEEVEPGVLHVAKGETHHGHVVLPDHRDAAAATDDLHLVACRRPAVSGVD